LPSSQAKRQAPAVYPPPIEGRAPTAVNAVFTGLDAHQWAVFMDLLREGIGAVSCTQDANAAPSSGCACTCSHAACQNMWAHGDSCGKRLRSGT
jgi:hypothetical protein